jgi:hypothetical protein
MHDEKCENCFYWFREGGEESKQGSCRRFPPQVPALVQVETLAGPRPAPFTCFPTMQAHGWCGEWSKNPSAQILEAR